MTNEFKRRNELRRDGCAGKVDAGTLRALLASLPPGVPNSDVLLGLNEADDAAVFLMDDGRAVAATLDFARPLIPDPASSGAIAAANAMSDVYAVGLRPLFALSILAVPFDQKDGDFVRQLISGAAKKCAEVGVQIIGGHSYHAEEILFGLSVIGTGDVASVVSKRGAAAGDDLILTKGIGSGVISEAYVRGIMAPDQESNFVSWCARVNSEGALIGTHRLASAMTDVTGFGLLGHLSELLERAPGISARLDLKSVPVFPGANSLARAGCLSGAAWVNRKQFGKGVDFRSDVDDAAHRLMLFDAETNGGLLVAVPPGKSATLMSHLIRTGIEDAAVVGTLESGCGQIIVV